MEREALVYRLVSETSKMAVHDVIYLMAVRPYSYEISVDLENHVREVYHSRYLSGAIAAHVSF